MIIRMYIRGILENHKINKLHPEWKIYTQLLKKLELYNSLPYTLANIRITIIDNPYDAFVKEQLSKNIVYFEELLEYTKTLEFKKKNNDSRNSKGGFC